LRGGEEGRGEKRRREEGERRGARKDQQEAPS